MILLPANMVNRLFAQDQTEQNLVSFVRKLWQTWLNSSMNAPRMQRGGDPDQELMSLLGMDASSMNFQGAARAGQFIPLELHEPRWRASAVSRPAFRAIDRPASNY